jgi:hypothetical protein
VSIPDPQENPPPESLSSYTELVSCRKRVCVLMTVRTVSMTAILFVPHVARAEAIDSETVQKLIEQTVAAQQGNLNHVWTMPSAALVLFMQVGS